MKKISLVIVRLSGSRSTWGVWILIPGGSSRARRRGQLSSYCRRSRRPRSRSRDGHGLPAEAAGAASAHDRHRHREEERAQGSGYQDIKERSQHSPIPTIPQTASARRLHDRIEIFDWRPLPRPDQVRSSLRPRQAGSSSAKRHSDAPQVIRAAVRAASRRSPVEIAIFNRMSYQDWRAGGVHAVRPGRRPEGRDADAAECHREPAPRASYVFAARAAWEDETARILARASTRYGADLGALRQVRRVVEIAERRDMDVQESTPPRHLGRSGA